MTPVTSATDAESLFAQYSDRLVRYLSGVAGEREAGRDLTQEVFLRVSRTAIPIVPGDQLAGWLFKIARNVAVDHHRGPRAGRQRLAHRRPGEGRSPGRRRPPQH